MARILRPKHVSSSGNHIDFLKYFLIQLISFSIELSLVKLSLHLVSILLIGF